MHDFASQRSPRTIKLALRICVSTISFSSFTFINNKTLRIFTSFFFHLLFTKILFTSLIFRTFAFMNLNESSYIKRCFELALKGLGSVSPNPLVGCVVVCNGEVIGEGYHQKYGEAHAEVNAIKSVKDKSLLQQSTLYVNLEPCAHYGKTPPCALRIIDEKIKRVVISNIDCFDQVCGKGIQMLKDAGIEVETRVLEEEGRWLNRRFFTFHEKKRPYIILKWAQTQDGFIDIDRRAPEQEIGSNWITNDELRIIVHKWRSEEDAIMVGSRTVVNDNPQLNVRLWTGKSPIRVVIDTEHQLTPDYHVFDGSIPTLLFVDKPYPNFPSSIEQILFPAQNSMQFVMETLHQRQIQSIIIEGGRFLLQSLIDEHLWDEARVLVGNKTFGCGLLAPKIGQTPESSTVVEGDTINIFTHKNF